MTPTAYLVLSSLLFGIGVLGVLIRRNVIVVLSSIELMLNAVNLIFVTFSQVHQSVSAQVFVFFVMIVAAAEVAVGLALLVAIYKRLRSTDLEKLGELKW